MPYTSFKSLKQKLITAFVCFAIVPLVTVGTLAYQRSHASLESRAGEKLFLQAQAAIDAIDRNLFERYGDVQAFAANPDARGSRKEAVAVANFFTENYGIYDLMIIADMDGSIVTANTVDHAGRPLDTSGLIGRSVKGEEWFEQCASGRIQPAHSYYKDLEEDKFPSGKSPRAPRRRRELPAMRLEPLILPTRPSSG